jgi:hypothetical protein
MLRKLLDWKPFENLGKSVNTVRLNNQTMRIRGNNVQISNGRAIVDGIDIGAGDGNKFAITTIIIEGDTKHVETDCGDITIVGNVDGDVKTDCGNIKIEHNLYGEAYTDCGDVIVKGRKI